jgi:hypothetical protein
MRQVNDTREARARGSQRGAGSDVGRGVRHGPRCRGLEIPAVGDLLQPSGGAHATLPYDGDRAGILYPQPPLNNRGHDWEGCPVAGRPSPGHSRGYPNPGRLDMPFGLQENGLCW